jgi:hypothetical protein
VDVIQLRLAHGERLEGAGARLRYALASHAWLQNRSATIKIFFHQIFFGGVGLTNYFETFARPVSTRKWINSSTYDDID